ncbi:MAG: hypothetical protein WAZ18_00905 [Alphaproteobacteria bacterium]
MADNLFARGTTGLKHPFCEDLQRIANAKFSMVKLIIPAEKVHDIYLPDAATLGDEIHTNVDSLLNAVTELMPTYYGNLTGSYILIGNTAYYPKNYTTDAQTASPAPQGLLSRLWGGRDCR